MDKNSLHFKGTYRNVYEVNRAYPNGGVNGDYVDINGWQHWWNPDRGTWCVNENRDSYWDEVLSTIQNLLYSKACVSESDFPLNPTDEEKRFGYFYNGQLYLWTGTNGTVRNGQYRSFGVVQGVGVSSIAQTATSNVDGGKNEITVTLTNGDVYKFFTYNGTGRNKGYYYRTLDELKQAVPSPTVTDWAIVDGAVYVCDEAGVWKDSTYSWKPIKLNPFVTELNKTDMPSTSGYLYWNGQSFSWRTPVVNNTGGTGGTTMKSLFFYGSGTVGGTTTNMGGFDGSVATYLHFQGSGVTVSQSTSNGLEHVYVNISGGSGSSSSSVSWSDVTNKPSTFAPSSHTHSTSDISGLASFVQGTKVTNATNANKATQLANARTIWGQSFNGTANIANNMSNVGNMTFNANETKFYPLSGYSDPYASLTCAFKFGGDLAATNFCSTGALKLGSSTSNYGTIEWDSSNSCFKINGSIYATGGITALGVSNSSTTSNNVDFTFNCVTAKNITANNAFSCGEVNISDDELFVGNLEISGTNNCLITSNNTALTITAGSKMLQIGNNLNIRCQSGTTSIYMGSNGNNFMLYDGTTNYKFNKQKALDLGILTT